MCNIYTARGVEGVKPFSIYYIYILLYTYTLTTLRPLNSLRPTFAPTNIRHTEGHMLTSVRKTFISKHLEKFHESSKKCLTHALTYATIVPMVDRGKVETPRDVNFTHLNDHVTILLPLKGMTKCLVLDCLAYKSFARPGETGVVKPRGVASL